MRPDGFDVTVTKSTGTLANLTATTNAGVAGVLASVANESWVRREIAPYINYFDNGADGHFNTTMAAPDTAANRSVPDAASGLGIQNYVVEAKATLYIPASGTYTFGVNSDDGFLLQILNPSVTSPWANFQFQSVTNGTIVNTATTADTFEYNATRSASDSFGVFNFTAAGAYQIDLQYFQGTGGGEVELFSAAGAKTAFDNTFTLVGDTPTAA